MSVTLSSRVTLLRQGICATVRCTIVAVRPSGGEGAHVLEVARRQPPHVREGIAQVVGQTVDHLGTPAFAVLAVQDRPANVPVQQHQRLVRG